MKSPSLCIIILTLTLLSCVGTASGQERQWRPLLPVDLTKVWHSAPGRVPEHTIAYDTLVAGIMNRVNLDSLISFVRILSGEDSAIVGGRKVLIRERSSQSGSDLAAGYMKEKLASYGLEVVDQNYSSTGRNIYATQRGLIYPEKQYIFCAHYDAVADYCADDNASGVAAVLEAARLLSQQVPSHSVVYALWDEEELGFTGSRYYASLMPSSGQQIEGVLNMDMLGWDGNGDFLADVHTANTVSSTDLANLFVVVDDVYGLPLNPVVYNPGTWQSDHSVFWDRGWGAILLIEAYYGGDLNPYYHGGEDRVGKFNLPYFHAMSRLSIGVLTTLLELTTGPTITRVVPDRGFQSYPVDVQINGFNTHFQESPDSVRAWLARDGNNLNADSLRVDDNTMLHAYFNIPVTAALGLWDVNVGTAIDGILRRQEIFRILPPSGDIVVSPESLVVNIEAGSTTTGVLTIHNNGERALTFAISGGITRRNYALRFDGMDDRVEIPNHPSLQLSGQITLESWIQFEYGGRSQPRILSKGADGVGYELLLTNSSMEPNLGFRIGPSSLISGAAIRGGRWYHVAAVYDGGHLKLYIDGVLDTASIAAGDLNVSDLSLYMGQSGAEASNNYRGRIDEIRIWNMARSQDDIQGLMTHSLDGTEPGLAAYWQFNEGVGDTAFDKSSNANHGTLLGGAAWTASPVPMQSWFMMSTDSGECPPHTSSYVVFTFNATEQDSSDHYSSIAITSDPFNPTVVLPIHMRVTPAVGAGDGLLEPLAYGLDQNYPNPFNPSTTIEYALPVRSHVTLSVFNTLGQQVATLVQGEQEAGYHEVQFDASGLASGVYLYRLQAEDFVQTRKLVLVR